MCAIPVLSELTRFSCICALSSSGDYMDNSHLHQYKFEHWHCGFGFNDYISAATDEEALVDLFLLI